MRATKRVGLLTVLTAGALLFGMAAVACGSATVGGGLETRLSLPLADSTWTDNEVSGLARLRLEVNAPAGELARLHAVLQADEGLGSARDTSAVGLDEAYVDLVRGDLSVRAGKQRVLWGSAYKLNPTSFVNPVNPADPLGERVAVPGLLGGYAWRDVRLNAVWLPEFRPALSSLPNPLDPSTPLKATPPEATLDNSEYAVRATKRNLAGFDASASYFHGWEDVPDVRLDPGSGQLKAYYPAVDRVGLDLVGAVGDAGLWLEGAVSQQPETDRQYHEVIAGADYTTRQGLYLVGQYYRLSEGHPLALGEVRDYAMVVGRKTVGDSLTVQVGGVYAFKGGATAWLPEATYNLTDGTDLVVGWVGTPQDTTDPLLKQMPSQAYAKLKLSF